MTTANAATAPKFLAAGTEQMNTVSAKLGQAWEMFQSYRATLADLRGLTDRQLSDVGLSRGQLKETARRAVYGH